MAEKKFKKERRATRVDTAIPARWGVTAECPRYGKILNLSSAGCLIKTQVEPLNGKTVFIRFGLPTGHSMELRGEVVQFRRNVGFAVEFAELSESDLYTLQQLVEYYRQMSPDDPRHGLALLSDYREALKELIEMNDETGEPEKERERSD
ncbi:MAG: PilZ domain-containing protein [Acidobacteria bacterium]|nr:PilZ domain-containing protein [Acidobacteriota bacterium]